MLDIDKGFAAVVAVVLAILLFVIASMAITNSGLKSTIATMERDAARVKADHATALAKTLAEAKAESERRAEAAQEVINAAQQRAQEHAARADRAARTAAGLRNEVDRLNRRELPSDPVAAGYAHEAREARELLGSCAAEYRSVGEEAGRLRDKVTDLQEWVHTVVGGRQK